MMRLTVFIIGFGILIYLASESLKAPRQTGYGGGSATPEAILEQTRGKAAKIEADMNARANSRVGAAIPTAAEVHEP
jgi:hypothetical protein